jgi:hypothetical protein
MDFYLMDMSTMNALELECVDIGRLGRHPAIILDASPKGQ